MDNEPVGSGKTIGKYRILDELGRGGMGTVYRAEDVTLGRVVALKVLGGSSDWGSDVVELFRQELKTAARLSHPNILGVFELNFDPDGTTYLVREFVDGESLQQILRRGPLSEADALTVAASVCQALAAAHDQRLIHRDIKPSNVLVPGGDRFDAAKLSDFGLTGLLSAQTGRTMPGQIFGTLYYMSPEQIRGEAQSAGTDLYGLGVLLYEMLYGSPPFTGALPNLLLQVLNQEVSFPAAPVISPSLRDLMVRLLAKDVNQRPHSARDVLSILNALRRSTQGQLADEQTGPIAAGPHAIPAERVSLDPADGHDPRRRAIWLSIAGGLVLVGGLVALTVASVSSPGGGGAIPLSSMTGVLVGVAIGASGVAFAAFLSRSLRGLRPALADDASRILLGAGRRQLLTQSLAIDVDKLISRCRTLDQRILGRSLALVVDQLQHANQPGDQLAVLPIVVSMTTQLSERLIPWYVRYEKVLAFFVAVVSLATGVVTVFQALR